MSLLCRINCNINTLVFKTYVPLRSIKPSELVSSLATQCLFWNEGENHGAFFDQSRTSNVDSCWGIWIAIGVRGSTSLKLILLRGDKVNDIPEPYLLANKYLAVCICREREETESLDLCLECAKLQEKYKKWWCSVHEEIVFKDFRT